MAIPDVQQLEKQNRGSVHQGNRIEVHFKDQIVGLVQSMQCSDDYGVQRANTIGHIESQELIPLESNHTLTVSMMILSKDSLYLTNKGLRAIPESGEDTNNAHNDALKARQLEIRVVYHNPGGEGDGKPLVVYQGCVYSSGTIDVTANRIVISNATFQAIHRFGAFDIRDT